MSAIVSPAVMQGRITRLGRTVDGAMFASVKVPHFFPWSNKEFCWKYFSGYLAEGFLVTPINDGEFYEIVHIRSGLVFSDSRRIRGLDRLARYANLSDRLITIKFANLLNKIESFLPQDSLACSSFDMGRWFSLQQAALPLFIDEYGTLLLR